MKIRAGVYILNSEGGLPEHFLKTWLKLTGSEKPNSRLIFLVLQPEKQHIRYNRCKKIEKVSY